MTELLKISKNSSLFVGSSGYCANDLYKQSRLFLDTDSKGRIKMLFSYENFHLVESSDMIQNCFSQRWVKQQR